MDDLDAIKEEFGFLDRQFFHSLVTETAFLASLKSVDFTSAIGRTIEGRVINRHLWVAHRKFRYQGDYTFIIEADDPLTDGNCCSMADHGHDITMPARLGPQDAKAIVAIMVGDAARRDLQESRESDFRASFSHSVRRKITGCQYTVLLRWATVSARFPV